MASNFALLFCWQIYYSDGKAEFIKGHTDIQNCLYSVTTQPNPGPNEINGKMSTGLSSRRLWLVMSII